MKDVLTKVKKKYAQLKLGAVRSFYNRVTHKELALLALSSVHWSELNHHGVKSIRHKYSGNAVYFLDMGDPYVQTILAYVSYERVTFKIGTWGDLVETGNYH